MPVTSRLGAWVQGVIVDINKKLAAILLFLSVLLIPR